jgi:hypothetical protein
LRVCAVRTASLSCAARKASTRIFTTVGRRNFLEAGKKRLAGDTAREATSDEVKEIQAQARQLKELVAELMIEHRLLKKSVLGDGESDT